MEIITKSILLFFFFLCSMYFSGIETAFMSVNLSKIKQKYKNKLQYFNFWENQPQQILATILLGNNLVNIGVGVITASLAIDLSKTNSFYGYILIIAVMIGLILIGEIFPKIYSKFNPEKISCFGIKYIIFLSKVFKPFTNFFVLISENLIKKIIPKYIQESPFLTANDLKVLLSAEENIEYVTDKEKKLLTNILSFVEHKIFEVKIPKEKIFSVNYNDDIDEIIKQAVLNKYSRIPVWHNNKENIIGIIYKKDLIMTCRDKQLFHIEDIIMPAHFISENYSVSSLLAEYKKGHHHMSIVKDKSNKLVGLITIEDIVEKIFGPVYDEYD